MTFLTKKQKQIFDYIENYIKGNGYAPTIKEIGIDCGGISVAAVHNHVERLVNKGLIIKRPHMSRAIELLVEYPQKTSQNFDLPVLGNIAEGVPLDPLKQLEFITVPKELKREGHQYVLIVKGDFLLWEGIRNDDYIVVDSIHYAEDKKLVIIVDSSDNLSIRKVVKKEDYFALNPTNSYTDVMIVNEKEIFIQGVIRGVIRKYL